MLKLGDHITKSIRIAQEDIDFLIAHYKTVSNGLRECVKHERYPNTDSIVLASIRSKTKAGLHGVFTKEEWTCLIDILEDVKVPLNLRCGSRFFLANLEDINSSHPIEDRWDVSYEELIAKVEKLSPAEIEAIYWTKDEFWRDFRGNIVEYVADL